MEIKDYKFLYEKMTSHTFYVIAQFYDYPPEVMHTCDSYSDAEYLCETIRRNAPDGLIVYTSRHYPGDLIQLNWT